MPSPRSQFPRALAERALTTTIQPTAADLTVAAVFGVDRTRFPDLGEPIPALLAHPDPDWQTPGHTPEPAPVGLWFHGRTAYKELDPGRFLRWVRAGIAVCSVDLPGHGQRARPGYDGSDRTLSIVEQAAAEVNAIVNALSDPRFNGAFDTSRLAIGGMSAGGMITLLRLTRPHHFRCAAVEATMGDFEMVSFRGIYDPERAKALSPMNNLDRWAPLPLLALHSEKDEWVPVSAIRELFDGLRVRYAQAGADPTWLELITWPETGALNEHIGFGKVSNEAKNLQVAFLNKWLIGSSESA